MLLPKFDINQLRTFRAIMFMHTYASINNAPVIQWWNRDSNGYILYIMGYLKKKKKKKIGKREIFLNLSTKTLIILLTSECFLLSFVCLFSLWESVIM